MEIDAGITDKISADRQTENQRLRKEGRCFECGQQGHLKRNCPKLKGKTDKPPPYKPTARTATTNKNQEEPDQPGNDPPDLNNLARSMKVLDSQKKEDLFDLLMEEPGF